jgi:FMN phosphatase YigB (HAD superfamily)
MPIRAVVFDVGETLVDETRHWGEWADWIGVPHLTFFGALGAVIERRGHHHEVFQMVRPGFDLAAARRAREATGWTYDFAPSDFYPDAVPCIARLRNAGYRIGIAGNQPEAAEDALKASRIEADFIASSSGWGVEKPSPGFFARVAAAAGAPPSEIAYVGDRLDNDVLPARAAGMTAVFIRRGPWGVVHARWPEVGEADIHIEFLDELPDKLHEIGER